MSLDRYRKKRAFSRTPEPPGAPPRVDAPAGGRRFVVQRHRATRLHYDLRLEIEGVLMSWAAPRGPSMRPLERRHAARTEDHPIEYLDFEGVIPRGEYGAGDMIVWDWGTWEAEAETPDPGAAVRSGELKLVLTGERLRGRFVLVRTRSEDASREQWLLIHKRDEHAEDAWDIDAFSTSVKTGRTNDEVHDGVPPPWTAAPPAAEPSPDLSAAREAPQPAFIAPMAATAVDRPFSDPDWLFELKLDGYRVEAVVRDGKVRLWTRNHLDAARHFPELAGARPTWIAADEAIVDGEVVALDPDGRPDFSLLQDRTGMQGLAQRRGERRLTPNGAALVPGPGRPLAPLVFHAFDLLHLDGRSLLDVPLEDRKRLLKDRLRPHPQVRYLSHITQDGELFHAQVAGQRLEGVIAKLRRSRYEPGRRSKAWLKIKVRLDQELVVVGYEPGRGTHTDLGSLLVAVHEDRGYRFAGEVGSGLDTRTRRDLRRELDALRVEDPPVPDAPRLPGARWAEPRLVIRAAFTEWTSDGLLRQSSYLGREFGRDPRSVTRERSVDAEAARASAERSVARRPTGSVPAVATSAAPTRATDGSPTRATHRTTAPRPAARASSSVADPKAPLPLVRAADAVGDPPEAVTRAELDALDALGKDGAWSVGGRSVNLTNLDKVLFPDAGLTKRDLVRYYVTIAPVILPYLRDRALNTDRWPDGISGHHFWQKQVPSHAPDWVGRWNHPEAGRDQSRTYVVADQVATMAWLANQAVIDLHPWTSRASACTTPTYALIDLDPGPRTTWEELLTLARLNRTALEHLGVTGFPKVTGKRGIQVWIPVEPRYTFDDTRDWVGALSQAVGAIVPDLVSWDWAKKDRGGRARLDFTQNAINKTLVAPYAVRPVGNAAVSAPILWQELDDPTLRPDRWDIHTILERVAAIGDPFRGALETTQVLPPLG